MDRAAALDKVKKCLALSRSANEHEAAAALRQAQLLMRRFNLTHEGVLASDVRTHVVHSVTKYRTPKWDYALVSLIALNFGCVSLNYNHPSGREWHFIGENEAPQVAAYAYEVLRRQMLQARDQHLSSVHSAIVRGKKRTLGNLYCLGWVAAVGQVVHEFAAGSTPPDETPAIKAYLQQLGPIQERKPSAPKRQYTDDEYSAYMAGVDSGSQAQLHRGVGEDAPEILQLS